MIRILVMVLAAANLLYFGWAHWSGQQAPRLVTPSPETASNTATVQAGTQCITLGPFLTDASALEFEAALRGMQLTTTRRTVTESVPDGWWVYVANADAPAQARVLRIVQAAGIRDAFVMSEDPQFRVSVGLFMEEAGARRRAEAVRALRLDAVVSERTQQQSAAWFNVADTPGNSVDLARLAAEGLDVQQLRVDACPAQGAAGADAVPAAATAPAPL